MLSVLAEVVGKRVSWTGVRTVGAKGGPTAIRRASPTAELDAPTNLVLGANIAGFRKVADAMIDQGVV